MKKTPDVVTAGPYYTEETSLGAPVRVQAKNSELRFIYQNSEVQGVKTFGGSRTYQAVQLEERKAVCLIGSGTGRQGRDTGTDCHRMGHSFIPSSIPHSWARLGRMTYP